MTKVIQVISDTNIGGAGYVVLNHLKFSDREKFSVKVVLPKGSLLKPEIEKLNYEVIETEYGADKSLDFKAISEFKKIFKAERPDVVHTHSSLSARIAAWRCGVKSRIYTKHCVAAAGKLHGIIGNRISTHIIAVSQVAKDILLGAGVKPDRITFIPNGVEPVRRLTEEEKVNTRTKFGITKDDFVFGITARLVPFKGHKYFIDAAKILTEKYENCKFLIVGIGEEEQNLKQQAIDVKLNVGDDALGFPQNNTTDKVIFTGFLKNVSAATNIMDVFVNSSSDTEASSLAMIEAMSVSTPVVATVGGGNPYMIEEGRNGLLVPIQDSSALAEAMAKMMLNKDLYTKTSQGAYEIYLEKFTAEIMTRQIEEIYERGLQR